jgi:hypothetical protein
MIIVGCDFHPSWQQVAWVDTETGETAERTRQDSKNGNLGWNAMQMYIALGRKGADIGCKLLILIIVYTP